MSEFNKIIIENCTTKQTIYEYLKANGFSENYCRNLRKKEGYIKLNNKIVFSNAIIKNGDVLEVYKNPNCNNKILENDIQLDIVYEDEDILVVNKPSVLATMPTRSHYAQNLSGAVAKYMKNKDENFLVRIVNRLDKDTAGLVVIAKHSLISNLLNSGNYIEKYYYAICTGVIAENLVIDKKIATTLNELGYNNNKREINENGKPAITYVKPIKNNGSYTLCKIHLKHGRTHQIRVHMSSIGYALLGDELYGQKSALIDHTALACCEMTINHPLKNKVINLKIDLPLDMKNLV